MEINWIDVWSMTNKRELGKNELKIRWKSPGSWLTLISDQIGLSFFDEFVVLHNIQQKCRLVYSNDISIVISWSFYFHSKPDAKETHIESFKEMNAWRFDHYTSTIGHFTRRLYSISNTIGIGLRSTSSIGESVPISIEGITTKQRPKSKNEKNHRQSADVEFHVKTIQVLFISCLSNRPRTISFETRFTCVSIWDTPHIDEIE